MYQTSPSVSDYIMGEARHFEAIMSFKNGTVLTTEISSLDRAVQTSGDDLRPGDVLSAALTGTLFGLADTILGQTFILSFVGIDYGNARNTYGYLHEYTYETLHSYTYGNMPGSPLPYEPIPMGEFRVTACTKQDDLWNFEAHDMLYASDKPYNSGLRYPATLASVEQELCNGLGLTARDTVESITVPTKPEGVTYRQMLGYIAGIFGKVCISGRTGKLEYKGFDEAGYVLDPDRAAEPEISQSSVRITSLHCGEYEAEEQNVAADRDITFDDPLMTSAYFSNVSSDWLGFGYTPLNVEHILGDPRLDPLDIVTVKRLEDNALFDVPLMSLNLRWDGGLMATLAATASTDTQYTADKENVKPFSEKVKKDIEASAAAMQEAIDYINGSNGGFVVTKFNEDGQPVATFYTDNLDPELATNVMKICELGILGTNAGMNSNNWKTAITNDGRINASQILTGILSAIVIQSLNYSKNSQTGAETGSQINLNDGTFSFGGGLLKFINNVLTLQNAVIRNGSFVVETSDEEEAHIHFTSGDWEIEISPLQWVLTNSRDHTKIAAQAGAVIFSDTSGSSDKELLHITPDYITFYNNGNQVATMNRSGHIETGGNVTAGGTVTASGNIVGEDINLKLSSSGGYISLRDYINNHP